MAVNSNDYVTIQGWMISELGLKGVRLITYAIIYSFSRDGHSEYYGSQQYIADFVCTDKAAISKALAQLVEDGLIVRRQIECKTGVRYAYRAKLPIVKTTTLMEDIASTELSKRQQGVENPVENSVDNIVSNDVDNSLYSDKVVKMTTGGCINDNTQLSKLQPDVVKMTTPYSNYKDYNLCNDNIKDNIYNNINNNICISQDKKRYKEY